VALSGYITAELGTFEPKHVEETDGWRENYIHIIGGDKIRNH
jgi:hypothetical protein